MGSAGLAVGLDDDLVGHAGDAEDELGGSFVEVVVLPPEAEVGASAVSGGGDERERVGVLVAGVAAPFEEAAGLVAGPARAERLGIVRSRTDGSSRNHRSERTSCLSAPGNSTQMTTICGCSSPPFDTSFVQCFHTSGTCKRCGFHRRAVCHQFVISGLLTSCGC